jgi:hypothetical protein
VLIKLGIVTTGVALLLGGTAQAANPTPPTCPSAVQIGSTGHVKRGTSLMATITQFEGCGGKYGHIRLTSSGAHLAEISLRGEGIFTPPTRGELNQRDVWTFTRALNDKCSYALATVWVDEDELQSASGKSC